MAAIRAFRVTQDSQIFSFSFRNRIQCIALYQLHNSQALLNLCRGYYRRLSRIKMTEQDRPDFYVLSTIIFCGHNFFVLLKAWFTRYRITFHAVSFS